MSTITQTVAGINKIKMFEKLFEIVSKGEYQVGVWWTIEIDEDTAEEVPLMCPISRLQLWYLGNDFDTDENFDDVFWYDPETPWYDLRHPSPREVARMMFSQGFLGKFLDHIDQERKEEALQLIQREINRLKRRSSAHRRVSE